MEHHTKQQARNKKYQLKVFAQVNRWTEGVQQQQQQQ
jgi:hypothetical protein